MSGWPDRHEPEGPRARPKAIRNRSEQRPTGEARESRVEPEGDGPSAGIIRKMNIIMAGTDAVAIDACLAKIVGLKPFDVNVTKEAARLELGEADLSQLQADVRVAGVDKRLMLIEPTEAGHVESSIIGREESVAKLLGISAETVLDRVHALTRRDTVGRTGVFVKRELGPDESFEGVLKKLVEANPAVRRRLRQ